ncbi:hypothetical protein BY458DRAFT_586627 [Sporodiniella umbellata]|nr:hypothetical protein BY458DRAFT_586627 [Sporodiniella umbellata]
MNETPFIVPLLTGVAGVFGAGLLGAIVHTQKSQTKRIQREHREGIRHLPLRSRPKKLTPAEYAIVQREARVFGLKALGFSVLLTWTGLSAVSWWFDVHSFQEATDRLKIMVPKQTSRLREVLGGKKFEMTLEEELELNSLDFEEEE